VYEAGSLVSIMFILLAKQTNKTMKKIITLLFLSLFTLLAFSQGRVITGTVTDNTGAGIPGVTVLLVGTNTGAITDLDGKFSLNASQGTLRFSFVGFTFQEIAIGAQNVINVVLEEELTELNEVVVIGYGTQLKRDVSTAVVVVDEESIRERPIVSAAQALQGKAAGVQVVQNSGKPGASMSVRVRGATSVLSSNDPLYVVDGILGADIRGLNPNDIESMTVLKDATSAAIYGSRGANGVVIITTKRGVDNQPLISFNTYYGMSDLRKPIEVLSTKQYRDLMNEISPNSIDPSETGYTNWSDEIFETGQTQSYQLSVSGGDSKNRYYVSGNYLAEDGIVRPANFERFSVRLNLDNELRPWLKMSTSMSVGQFNSKDTPDNLSSGRGGVIMSALNTPPFLSIYSDDPNQAGWFDPNPFQPSWENPVAYMEGPDQKNTDRLITGSVSVEARIIEGLYYRPKFGVDMNNHQWDYFLDPVRTVFGRQQNGIGRASRDNSFKWLFDHTLDYSRSFGEHNFTVMAGSSAEKFRWENSYMEGTDYNIDYGVQTINAANVIQTATTNIQEWSMASFMGRVTYNYAGKYYFLANYRVDGTSKLSNPWGNMPSASVAWRISSEPFMQGATFIDDLKLRAGWGITGNVEGISNYSNVGGISFVRRPPTNPASGPSIVNTSYGNPDLKWETTEQTNLGFDLTILRGRVVLAFDTYLKKSKDVILPVQLQTSLSPSVIITNAGEIENRGLEFSISSMNTVKTFKWSTDLNMSFNKNEVTSLNYTKIYSFGHVYSNNESGVILREGVGLGTFFGYISDGVNPETGDITYRDINQNGILDPGDRTIIGSGMPDFIFGITNTFNYKKFDFSFFLQGSYGNEVFNSTRIDLEGMFDSKNQSIDVLRRWTPENTITDIPRAIGGGNTSNVRNSSRFVEDGSYVRLKSITLAYRLLENHRVFKLLSLYVTGQNLLTLTDYTGFDPEVSQYGNNAIETGFDYGTYPQSRTVIVGINVQF